MRKHERRRTVFKKRRNVGVPKVQCNSPTVSADDNVVNNVSVGLVQTTNQVIEPIPNPVVTSASKHKIGDIDSKYKSLTDDSDNNSENVIVDLKILNAVLKTSVKCAKCDSIGLRISIRRNYGLSSELQLFCEECDHENRFFSSQKVPENTGQKTLFEHNVRLAYGLRSIGKGHKAAKILCGIMNLPPPPTKFDRYNEVIGSVVEDVCFKSMDRALEEAVSCNDGIKNIAIAMDGTWQKRGYTSLNGAVSATSVDTNKVIDVAIFSKFCKCPNKNAHLPNCSANYDGCSGGMEVAGATQIFKRSVSRGVCYTEYLGDGDSKGFSAVEGLNLYKNEDGSIKKISKLECIGHIQKRMGTRLRNLKKDMKGQKLKDGKPLGGKGRLTDGVIDQIQNYYGQAIRKNVTNLQNMQKAVWAIYYHKISTDNDPHHGLCPKGSDSWCKYQQSIVTKTPYTHSNSVPVTVMETIKPIFSDLARPDLLKKCLHGRTQNPNESLNSVIWNRLPKSVFVGLKTLHFGVYDAIASYNEGYIVKCDTLRRLSVYPGKNMIQAMISADKDRVYWAQRHAGELYKKARQARRHKKRKLEEEQESVDDPSYGPGLF